MRDDRAACALARPDMAFSSDFIVGFPGESEEDFDATLSLIDESAMPEPSRSNTRLVPVRRRRP